MKTVNVIGHHMKRSNEEKPNEKRHKLRNRAFSGPDSLPQVDAIALDKVVRLGLVRLAKVRKTFLQLYFSHGALYCSPLVSVGDVLAETDITQTHFFQQESVFDTFELFLSSTDV